MPAAPDWAISGSSSGSLEVGLQLDRLAVARDRRQAAQAAELLPLAGEGGDGRGPRRRRGGRRDSR